MTASGSSPSATYSQSVGCGESGCDGRIPWDWDRCTVCGVSIEPPNVRWALSERGHLDHRYQLALADLESRGVLDIGMAFEAAVGRSVAVIGVPLEFALQLLEDHTLHQNYHHGVSGSARLSAAPENDIVRRTVDAQLYGGAGQHISMAALCLDGLGLASYGRAFLQLKDLMCAARGSVLAENSYTFVERYSGGTPLPAGHRSIWQDRTRLALVERADRLSPGMTAADFPSLLLRSTGDRKTDRFMEVHIYGPWNVDGITGVKMVQDRTADRYEEALVERLTERLHQRGLRWDMVA